MKRLRSAIWEVIPWGLLALLQACANGLPCPGEPGAPMDQWGNEVNTDSNGNHEQRLNTDCYYGRGDNGKVVLLTQKPQTGFWNSSIFRTDETTPLNTQNAENPQDTPIVQNEAPPVRSHALVENSTTATELESMVASGANPPPAPEPMPLSGSQPAPTPLPPSQKLYYRSGKVKGECGPVNVYREAYVPPCPPPSPPPPVPLPVQRTYIQNNYPPVAVQTGEPPAQAAGVFLGGVGQDVLGAGVLTYAIRYRPDQITNNSYSNSSASSTSALSHARLVDPGHGQHFHHPPGPHGFDPHHHPQRFEAHHHTEPHEFEARHQPDPKGGQDSLMGMIGKW